MTTWRPDELAAIGNADEGNISAGGVDKDVAFAPVTDPGVNDQLDAAYRTKYSRYGGTYVDSIVACGAREATLKLVPR